MNYPDTLDARGLADYIEDLSSSEVDHEMIWEYFRGTVGILKKVPLSSIQPGPEDVNIPNPELDRQYAKMDVSTVPPLVVEDGTIVDGHHRYRVLKSARISEVWIYDVVDE